MQEVQVILEKARECGEFAEVEVRFGRAEPHRPFEPGMSVETLSALEEALDAFRDWSLVKEWSLTHAFQHGSAIPGDARMLRTEAIFKSDTDVVVATRYKRPVASCTYSLDGAVDHQGYRVALSSEEPVPSTDVPLAATPARVCIKLRKEYLYTPSRWTRPVWAFHLTQRWAAGSFIEAVAKRVSRPPACDIELELVDLDYLHQNPPEEVVFHLQAKIRSVLRALHGSASTASLVHRA